MFHVHLIKGEVLRSYGAIPHLQSTPLKVALQLYSELYQNDVWNISYTVYTQVIVLTLYYLVHLI